MSQIVGIIVLIFWVAAVIWGIFFDFKNPFKKKEKTGVCDRCAHLKRKCPENGVTYRYVCKAEIERGYDYAPEYCSLFEERNTHDSNLDT